MLYNYDNNYAGGDPQPRPCPRCVSGIMILTGIISGILFSILTTLLFINFLLPLAYFGILTALIVALVFLFVLLISSAVDLNSRFSRFVHCNIGGLFLGIFGTIFSGILGISAMIFPFSIAAIVFVALTAFFFAYMLVSMLFIIR